MFRFSVWAITAVMVCVLAARTAQAGIGFQPVSPDELKMTSEPQAPGAAAVILYRQVDRNDDIHIPHEDDYIRIKILTEEGRKQADVEIPFVKNQEDIVNIHARTIRPDGSTVDFGGKVYEKYIVKGKFSGIQIKILVKTFTLPDVQVGSVIEYGFTHDYREYTLNDSHWFLSEDLFTRKARFTLKPFLSDADNPYGLRWTWNLLPPGTSPPQKGADHVVRMDAANVPAFETEDYMPPADELKSRVDFIYEEGFLDKDAEAYWKRLEKKLRGESDGVVNKRGAMEQAVSQIVSAGDPPEIKLRKIYDRVQQLRNTSYEEEKTEQEQKRAKQKTSDNANVEQVWKRGYGNGIQLTRLFLGLVRAAGFEAYECWVSTRNEYFFSPALMQSHKLNSNVVVVKLNGKDIYLDPGGAFTPFGLLMWSETGVSGLKLDKDSGTWILTTLPQASESQISRVGKFKLTDTGDLEGTLAITFTGLEAMDYRLGERHVSEVERKKFLEDWVQGEIGASCEIDLTNQPDWTSSETPLVAEYKIKIPGWVSGAGKRAMVPAALFTSAEKGVFDHTNRTHPIYFQYPYLKSDDVTIDLPPGWQITSVPGGHNSDGHVVQYTLKVEKNGTTLHLTRKLSFDVLLLDKKYYGALRDFFQSIRTSDSEQIVLQPGEIHASN
jgi:hypothetical protein